MCGLWLWLPLDCCCNIHTPRKKVFDVWDAVVQSSAIPGGNLNGVQMLRVGGRVRGGRWVAGDPTYTECDVGSKDCQRENLGIFTFILTSR